MGVVKLTNANKRTLAKRQKTAAPKTVAPKVEPLKEPTVSELKVFADLIKSGHKAFIYRAAKADLDAQNRLTLTWVESAMGNPMDALWNVKAVVTTAPRVEDAPADGYYIKTRTIKDGSVEVQFFQAPKRADGKLTIADKVKWINDGKPCGYRYGFSWKGAGTHRISTGEAKDRLARKKYFDCEVEHRMIGDVMGDYLVFAEYSAADMD